MKNFIFFLRLTLLFVLALKSSNCNAQSFFDDFVKFEDSQTKPSNHLSQTKLHLTHKQFSNEYKKLFYQVKVRAGFDMLNCDTLYIFESQSFYEPNYSRLVWNKLHSCFYENPSFSLFHKFPKKPIIVVTNAEEKLRSIGPVLEKIIEKVDTRAFTNYIHSSESPPLGDLVKFVVAIKEKNHWHFISSNPYLLIKPD